MVMVRWNITRDKRRVKVAMMAPSSSATLSILLEIGARIRTLPFYTIRAYF